MKRVLKYTIITILIYILPFIVNAATSLSVSTQSPIVGSTIYVQLNINYSQTEKISEAHYIISFGSDNFTLEDVIWNQSAGTYRKEKGLIYIDKTSNTSGWEYGGPVQLKLKVNKSGVNKISISENGVAKYENGSIVSQTYSGVTISAIEANDDNKIGSLAVEGYNISPTFNKDVYEYTLKVPADVSSVNIITKKGNSKQNISGDGEKKLQYGANRVRIKVTAENGSEKTYEIMITREDDRTKDISLKSLSVSNTDIVYDQNKAVYTATVSKSIDSVIIDARANDSNATLTGTGKKDLNIGTNTFYLKITSSMGKEKTYTINIIRSENEIKTITNSANLSSLIINNTTIKLDDKKTTYLYGVNSNVNDVNISCTKESNTAEININKEELQYGINVIKITVTDNDLVKNYRILIYRPSINNTIVSNFNVANSGNNIEYNSYQEENHTLSSKDIDFLKTKKKLIYNVVNEYKGLLYQLKTETDILEDNIDLSFNQKSDTPLTYETNLKEGIEVTLYVGDIFTDNLILKINTFNDDNEYNLLTEGVKVVNGYIVFTTNGDKNYVFSIAPKTNNNNYINYIKYGFIILLFIIIIIFIVSILLKKKSKINKVNDKPLY